MGRVVMVCADTSVHSKNALAFFINNVMKPDDMVVIAHIAEPPHLPTLSLKTGMAPPVDEWHKAIQDQMARVQKLETDFEYEMLSRKIKYKFLSECHGKPGEGLVAIAHNEGANMIVMGTRGLDSLRRTLIGSVSDYVLRHSSIPVLVCPKPADS